MGTHTANAQEVQRCRRRHFRHGPWHCARLISPRRASPPPPNTGAGGRPRPMMHARFPLSAVRRERDGRRRATRREPGIAPPLVAGPRVGGFWHYRPMAQAVGRDMSTRRLPPIGRRHSWRDARPYHWPYHARRRLTMTISTAPALRR